MSSNAESTAGRLSPGDLDALPAALPVSEAERERMLAISVWVSVEDAARLDGVSVRTAQRRIGAGVYQSREEPVAVRGGKPRRQVHVGSLQRQGALAQHFSERGLEQGQTGVQRDHSQWALASETEKARALERREAVLAVKRLRKADPQDLKAQLAVLARNVTYKGKQGVGLRTLYRWEKLLDEHGLDGLLPSYQKERASRALTPEMVSFIHAVRLDKPRMNAKQVYAAFSHAFASACQGEGAGLPSYKTVARECERVPLAALAASEGPKTLDKYLSFTDRDWSGIEPNQVVFLDSRTMDTEVRVYRNRAWRIVRPRVVFMFDAGCRMWQSMQVCVDSVDADAVCSAFQMAVDRWGRPVELYRDNGKDYQSQQFNAAVAKVGIAPEAVHDAIPYNAKSKAIEPAFNAFRQRLEPALVGYTGINAAQRPESLRRQEKRGELLTLEEYAEVLESAMIKYNEEHEHTGLKGLTPRQARDGWVERGWSPVWVDEEVLRSIVERESDAVIRNSTVRVNGERYWSEQLALHHGERVKVVWNAQVLASVTVMLPTGEALKATHCERTVHGHQDTSHKDRASRKKRERRVIREYRELTMDWAGGQAPVAAAVRSTIEPTDPHAVLAHSRERQQHIKRRDKAAEIQTQEAADEVSSNTEGSTILDIQRRQGGRLFEELRRKNEETLGLISGRSASA